MAHVLVNEDNTVNFIADDLTEDLILDDVDAYEIKGKTAVEVQNNIPPQYCVFDKSEDKVVDLRVNEHLIKDLVFEKLQPDEKADYIRRLRKRFMKSIDLLFGNSIWFDSLTSEEQEAAKTYRKDLLDITDQESFPDAVEWPLRPTFL